MCAKDRYVIVYVFRLLEGTSEEFMESWKALTKLIYEHAGSYGSRLHRTSENEFIAYAQWPDKATYDNSANQLPKSAIELRQHMRSCCAEIKQAFEMLVEEDLLQDIQHRNS